jgi:hypothetical protein
VDYELTVKIPTAGAGTPVHIVGIGEVKNGSTVQVDSEQAAQFKNLTGVTLGRANFQEGIDVKALRGAPTKKADEPEEPAPVQNKDGETAKGDK